MVTRDSIEVLKKHVKGLEIKRAKLDANIESKRKIGGEINRIREDITILRNAYKMDELFDG